MFAKTSTTTGNASQRIFASVDRLLLRILDMYVTTRQLATPYVPKHSDNASQPFGDMIKIRFTNGRA
jgi:hypothetical protein